MGGGAESAAVGESEVAARWLTADAAVVEAAPLTEARALARKALRSEAAGTEKEIGQSTQRVDSEHGEEVEAAPHRKRVRKATRRTRSGEES
jgi:hypothetical protein